MTSWKQQLGDRIPDRLGGEVDLFEGQIELKKEGKIDDKIFAETRLRRGVYGQRYDNGLRDDGTGQQPLHFPCGDLTKGPDTVWDAPGMMRIKIPFGKLSAEQLDTLAELAEEYSDSILHVTTRQDIQLHFVHIEDTPDMMRRLAAVGITTREACGNSVRNVTACEYAGVCKTQAFDVTPYANAITQYLLGHPDVQDFGRKFKIAFSGCEDNPCGLVTFHDLGAVAQVRDGKRGFRVVVGGGLGAVPVQAKVLDEFCPEEELLPLAQAVSRVFARLGEKQSRARARIKFLVQKLGIDEFKKLVAEERETLRPDERWTAFLDDLHSTDEQPVRDPGPIPSDAPAGFQAWAKHNLRPQAQNGYYVAIIKMPLGDFTSTQGRTLSDLARQYTGDSIRCTVEQNLAFRWLSGADAVAFYEALDALNLSEAGAGTITDMTSCPGTDTCKLGISASRGLTGELRKRLDVIKSDLPPAVESLRIKASGCFNSCGQHHAADIGFTGVSRQVGGRKVPHFNLVLGGQWTQNAKSYGLVVGAVPSKNIPKAVELITAHYMQNREGDESFQAFIARVGKKDFRKVLAPIQKPPSYEEDPSYYSDWGDPREYNIGDIGVGECAGEIVPFVEFGLQEAEQQLHDAQDALEAGHAVIAAAGGFRAMVTAAKALVRHLDVQVKDDADDVVANFKTHLHDTQLFHDPFAKGKFATYLLKMHADKSHENANDEIAHRTLDESQLFIEAAHSCYQRLTESAAAAAE
ncbi:MAG: nitrite/sulfite reductase [Myxococcales bacterium]|nr:nitrite/sulfite reductase [Myxococcales bacterium]MDH3484219.1 nitrite/sulfite reductase [Myxococcales bacterium]